MFISTSRLTLNCLDNFLSTGLDVTILDICGTFDLQNFQKACMVRIFLILLHKGVSFAEILSFYTTLELFETMKNVLDVLVENETQSVKASAFLKSCISTSCSADQYIDEDFFVNFLNLAFNTTFSRRELSTTGSISLLGGLQLGELMTRIRDKLTILPCMDDSSLLMNIDVLCNLQSQKNTEKHPEPLQFFEALTNPSNVEPSVGSVVYFSNMSSMVHFSQRNTIFTRLSNLVSCCNFLFCSFKHYIRTNANFLSLFMYLTFATPVAETCISMQSYHPSLFHGG